MQQGSGFDLVLVIFLLKSLLKTASKSFFGLWHRDSVLELQFLTQVRVVLLYFAVFADRIVMAASRLDIVNRIGISASSLR